MLKIIVEFDGEVRGLGLSLWYGDYPRRKRLVLLDGSEMIPLGPGRLTKTFLPEDARCPNYRAEDLAGEGFDGFPPRCIEGCPGGKWSESGPECAFDYRSSTLYLAAEGCGAEVRSSVSLVDIRYYPDPKACACESETGCHGGRECDTSARAPAPWYGPDAPDGAGICAVPVPVVPECGRVVGLYGGGVAVGGSSIAFLEACMRYSPALGVPFDNGGSQYVHPACPTPAGLQGVRHVEVQDFLQSDARRALSRNGHTMLMRNPDVGQAFLLYDDILWAYICLHAPDGCEDGMGGSSLLGPPTEDRHITDGRMRQNFAKGWITVDASTTPRLAQVHLNEQPTPAIDPLQGCPRGANDDLRIEIAP
jgi:hypothetical protein